MTTIRSRPAAMAVGIAAILASCALAGSFAFAQQEEGGAECSDGIDNDGNGQIDALVSGGNEAAQTEIGGGNPFVLRGFVNAAAGEGGFAPVPENGALHNDAATAAKVCQLAGYREVVSTACAAPAYGGRCGYESFDDNETYAWGGAAFAPTGDNQWLSSVTCRSLAAACGDGEDNDGDGRIDTADGGCVTVQDASEVEHDARCADPTDRTEGVRECKDGLDNDGDGFVDFDGDKPDDDCADVDDDDESDGADESGDQGSDDEGEDGEECSAAGLTVTFEGDQGPWEDVSPNGDARRPSLVGEVFEGGTVTVTAVSNNRFSARLYNGDDELPIACGEGTLSFTDDSNHTLLKVVLSQATGGVEAPEGSAKVYVSHDEPISTNYFDNSGRRDNRPPCTVTVSIDNVTCEEEEEDPVLCPETHPTCYQDGDGGAQDACEKEGKIVEWEPEGLVCTLPNGGDGKCYTCVDPPQGCPEEHSCGDPASRTCPEGQQIEWAEGRTCRSPLDGIGQASWGCYRCVGEVEEDPPVCPVGCETDADCTADPECDMDPANPEQPACWKDAGTNTCVKRCLVAKCVDKQCAMVPPTGTPTAPLTPCEAQSCPAPRCGDGIVQTPAGADEAEEGADDDAANGEAAGGETTCPAAYPVCSGVRGPTLCPPGHVFEMAPANVGCVSQNHAANCFRCVPGTYESACTGYSDGQGGEISATRPHACANGRWWPGLTGTCTCIVGALPGTFPTATVASVLTAQAQADPAGEECDDGNTAAGDGCSASCTKEICGDGTVQENGADGLPNTSDDETCDDGNLEPGDGCSNLCAEEGCGNGVVDVGEECDEGDDNADDGTGICRTDCSRPSCGDGTVDAEPPYGEQCDCGDDTIEGPGGSLYCDIDVDGVAGLCQAGTCRALYCGDGFQFNDGVDLEPGTADDEMCDAGPLNIDGPLDGESCSDHAHCSGEICVEGECTLRACTTHDQCDGGKCLGGRCVPGGCTLDADCSAGSVCTEGACTTSRPMLNGGHVCVRHNDCPSGICTNGFCADPFEPPVPGQTGSTAGNCRLDCKPARCGDGVVDTDAGETCDEGQAMFRCAVPPYAACDCGIPSWGSSTRPGGTPLSQSCCGGSVLCQVAATSTCPSNCGVVGEFCGNGRIEEGEECDVSDAASIIVFRPNLDGTKTSFAEDDGRWGVVPASVEKKFAVVDHAPVDTVSPDSAFLRSKGQGTALTYFHLWDVENVPGTPRTIVARAGVDFAGTGWRVLEAVLTPKGQVTLADLNAAALVLRGDETDHSLSVTLYHATGRQLTGTGKIVTPVAIQAPRAIDVDALEILVHMNPGFAMPSCVGCRAQRCGDGTVHEGEQCDDGDAESGDGCTNRCELEICALPDA